jgi:SWI/SNF-related matrix-associated actin-dependent regulator 1 of chromatin subfamily A
MIHMAGACSYKIDAIVADLLEYQEKVVIFAYHHGVIETYAERLRQAGRKVVVLTGDNTKQTDQIVRQFQTDPEIQFFVGNMKVAGQGLTLTAASVAVFAELDWSPGVMEQCEDRLHRIGQEKPVKIIRYLLEHSLDGVVVGALGRKLNNSRIALNPQIRLVQG